MSAVTEPWMDDLETQLSTAAGRVSARLRARRRSRRIASLAVAAVLVVGGVAIAETTPFHPLASFQSLVGAQRETTPDDAVGPALREQLERWSLAGLQIDQTRLMAALPGGARLYAAPVDDGKLCLIYVLGLDTQGIASCGPRLGPDVPITFITSSPAGPGTATVVTGLARDDVRSVSFSFSVGGQTVTTPVHDNAFWYSADTGPTTPFAFTVELADGSTVVYPQFAETP